MQQLKSIYEFSLRQWWHYKPNSNPIPENVEHNTIILSHENRKYHIKIYYFRLILIASRYDQKRAT